MDEDIFIAGNMPSSKNSKQWTGKFLVNSKTTQKYIKDSKQDYLNSKQKFLDQCKGKSLPLSVEFHFVRGSKHKFDYVNPCQTILDLMVKYEWIEDDNADVIIPVYKPYTYNKDNPGVFIKVI